MKKYLLLDIVLGLGLLGLLLYTFFPKPSLLNTGENPALGHKAEIIFDRAVDQTSVLESAQAFHPTEELKGYFTWLDQRTLQYQLESPQDISSFSIVFQKPIQDTWGREVSLPTKLDFFPQESNGELTFQNPKNGAENVAGKSPLTLMWDQPVLPLQNAKDTQTKLQESIQITPPHPGNWQVLGSSGLLFEPKEPWKGSTEYRVEIDPALTGEGLSFTFTTPRLEMTGIESADLIDKKALQLIFDQEIDLAKIKAALEVSPRLDFDLSYGTITEWKEGKEVETPSQSRIRLTPRTPWEGGREYKVHLPLGSYSAEGPLESSKDQTQTFKTIQPFMVDNLENPYSVFGHVSLQFSHPVKGKTLLRHLTIEPSIKTETWEQYLQDLDWESDYESQWFSFPPIQNGAWEAKKEYSLVLSPGLTDIYGRPLEKEYRGTFTSTFPTEVRPIFLPGFGSVIDKEADLEFSFQYSGQITGGKVTFKQILPETKTLSHDFTFAPSPDKRSSWALNLRETFGSMFGEDGRLPSGKFEMQFTFPLPGRDYPAQWNTTFYASDFGVLLKSGVDQTWDIALQDFEGNPILEGGIIQGYGYDGQALLKESVDAFPTLIQAPNRQPESVLITVGDRVGVGSLSFQQKINPYDAQINFSPWEYQNAYKGVLINDRPLFRPGDTVHIKALVREKNIGEKAFILKSSEGFNQPYTVKIMDPFWKEIAVLEGTTQDGSLYETFEIPADSPLGSYRTEVLIGETVVTSDTFHIQEFRKPKFLIETTFDQDQAIAEETLTARVKAQYAFGGALKGKSIRYNASLFGQEVCPFWGWWCPSRDKNLISGQGVLDDQGTFEIPIKLELEADEVDINWNVLTLNVTVIESSNEQSSQSLSIPFYPSEHQLRLDPGLYFYHPEDEAEISGIVTDLPGEPLGDQPVNIGLYQIEWVRNDRKGASGDFYGEWEEQETLINEVQTRTNDQGRFEMKLLVPEEGGNYRFIATNQDTKGRTVKAQQAFWVAGKDQSQIRLNDENKIVQVLSDKKDYEVGETVEIFFPIQDFEIEYARATIERGTIFEDLPLDLENNTITLETEAWMAPNVYVSLFLQGKNTEGQNDIRWGVVNIPVKDPSKVLELSVMPDKATYRPGQEVTLKIETQVQGEGTPGEVTVAVVDQTLLALRSRPPLDLWQYFLAHTPLGVTTSHTLDQFMSKSQIQDVMEEADMIRSKMALGFGGGGGEDKLGEEGVPRGDFRDTAAFLATVKTDENGQATETFTLPDNLTTWDIYAIAATTNNAFGQTQDQIQTTLPLLISEIMPNFFHLGDELQIGVLVRKNQNPDQNENVTVTLQAPEWWEVDEREKVVLISDEARVFFTVKIPFEKERLKTDEETVIVGFEVKSDNGLSDSLSLRRPLTKPTAQLSVAEFLHVTQAQTLSLLPNLAQSLPSELMIKVFSSLAGKLAPLVTHIAEHNYGCTEQELSYITSVLLQDKLNRSLGREGLDLEKLNLQTRRDAIEDSFLENGFGFWKSSPRPNLWVTAQVLQWAPLWAEYDAPFDPQKLEQALQYVETEAERECKEEDAWTCLSDGERAHAFFVLQEYGQDINLTFASKYTDSLEAKIWWLKTYQAIQQKGGSVSPALQNTAQTFWQELEDRIRFRDRYAFWEGGSSFYSQDERITALIYPEIKERPAFEAFVPKIIRYLVESPTQNLSTNTSLYLMAAMIEAARDESQNTGAQYVVQRDKKTALQGTLETPESEAEYSKELTTQGLTTLNFFPKNEKPYYADVQMQEVFPSEHTQALMKGFWIEKEIFDVNDTDFERPLKTLKVGENYRVRVRLVTNTAHRQVMVEDFIPSGAEIVNFEFENADQTLKPEPDFGIGLPRPVEPQTSTRILPPCHTGWCRPTYDHSEFHYEKAQFFMDHLSAGTHEIEYFIQTRLPGTFELKPSRVEEMYFPEVFGTSEGVKVKITE